MAHVSPFGAVLRGLAAGVAGAAVQTAFFKATAKITPKAPKDAFHPPEEEQQNEMATQTVARRVVEGLMHGGPLTDEQKGKGAQIVHYSFGGMWGGLYGLTVETFPGWKGVLGTTAFSSIVWMVSDNFILPFFRLSAWPQASPAKNPLYAWVAHLAYGAGLLLTYRSLTSGVAAVAAGYSATRFARRTEAVLPAPVVRSAVKPAVRFLAKPPVRRFVEAML